MGSGQAAPFSVWLDSRQRDLIDRAAAVVGVSAGALARRGALDAAALVLGPDPDPLDRSTGGEPTGP